MLLVYFYFFFQIKTLKFENVISWYFAIRKKSIALYHNTFFQSQYPGLVVTKINKSRYNRKWAHKNNGVLYRKMAIYTYTF